MERCRRCPNTCSFQLTLAFSLKSKLAVERKIAFHGPKDVCKICDYVRPATHSCINAKFWDVMAHTLAPLPADIATSSRGSLISDVAQCQITRRHRSCLLLTIFCHCLWLVFFIISLKSVGVCQNLLTGVAVAHFYAKLPLKNVKNY